jgi:hypothetical protein
MVMELSLDNVINISVSEPGAGAGEYNPSNLALFTHEVPGGTFGSLGYQIYLSPTQVGIDFGTNSETFKMANAVFSQNPNILANNGYLVVILMENDLTPVIAIQHLAFSTVPTVGNYKLGYNGNFTADIAFDDDAAAVQAALRLVAGLATVTVTGDTAAGFNVTFTGISGPALLLVVSDDSLQDTDGFDVFITPTTTTPGVAAGSDETLAAAITRTVGLVQYFGIMVSAIQSQTDMLAAAAVVQPLNKIAFFVSRTAADVAPGGKLDLLTTGGFWKSRGLFYGGADDNSALVMMASYAGRGLSTNFNGSNTTQNMHLKDLSGVQPDPSMTQTLLNQCVAAGADSYPSLQGVAKVFCSGVNRFFDQVYNLGWFVGALQIAGFNYLAQSSTKVPQTENGMSGLRGAYRQVCEQAVTNQYLAPGRWTLSTTFGNLNDFIANIAQVGYYMYSVPISQQSQVSRGARQAPSFK